MDTIEKLLDYLDYLEYCRGRALRELKGDTINDRYRAELVNEIIPGYKREIKIVSGKITAIEGCEHANVEDTGGPDGSQICMDCGRIN